MSKVSLPKLSLAVFRVIGVIGVSLALLVGGATAASASTGTVTSSDPINLKGYAGQVVLTPDRLYYSDSVPTCNTTACTYDQSSYVSSILAGPKLTSPASLGTTRGSGVFASAGRAITVDNSGNATLLDRGVKKGGLLLPQRAPDLGSLSGSWYLSSGSAYTLMTSLNGQTSDVTGYFSSTSTSTSATYNWLLGQLGSLFAVETDVYSISSSGSYTAISNSVAVIDAASGNKVLPAVKVQAPPGTGALLDGCSMQVGEVDCGWEGSNSANAWVTRLNYATGKTTTVTLTAPAGMTDIQWVDWLGDGFASAQTVGPNSTYDLYAYDLGNPLQYAQLNSWPYASYGSMVASVTYNDSSTTTNGYDSLNVARLPFGGGSVPTLIGVVGGMSPVSAAAPLKLDLDFSKPVGAGTLTVTDSTGKVVGQVYKTQPTPDGSLRGLTWTPPVSAAGGTYKWTFDATDSNGQHVVANVGSGPASGSFTVMATCSTFSDVAPDNQFAPHICWMAANKITTGMTDTTYAPRGSVTREAMAAFMYRLAGVSYSASSKPSFPDVTQTGPGSNQFFTEIEWMNAMSITHGMDDGTYAPKSPVTREAMAAFLYRLAGSPSYGPPSKPSFPDVSNDKNSKNYNQFYTEIEWMNAMGITTGMADGTYAPKQPVTREAMAAFMWRMSSQQLYCTTYTNGTDCP